MDYGNSVKKVVFVTVLAIYTVLCGIIIADCGADSVAGGERQNIVQSIGELVLSKSVTGAISR